MQHTTRDIIIKNENIEKVNKFKYLGACITSKNEVTGEIKKSLIIRQFIFLLSPESPNQMINIR